MKFILKGSWQETKQPVECKDEWALSELLEWKIKNSHRCLTWREQQVFHLTVLGLSARQIGLELDLSNRTIEDYIGRLKMKLAVETKQELIQTLLTQTIPINMFQLASWKGPDLPK